MNQASKHLFTIVLVLLVCVHFVLILFYCLPTKIENQKFNFVNKLYIYPLFHQNWNLFVPAPNAERKLFVRFKTKNGFSNWEDILSREIANHKTNRLLGNEARVLLLSNSLIIGLNSIDETPSSVLKNKPTNSEFKVLQFEIENYLKLEYAQKRGVDYELLLVSSAIEKTKAYYIPTLVIN